MQKFYFNENEKTVLLIKHLGETMRKYNQKDLDASESLLAFLNNSINIFKNLAQPDNETWMERLKTEYTTAKNGINPITLEQPVLGKRTMLNNTCFKIMQEAETKLSGIYENNNMVLKQAETLIGQIVIAGLQSGIITDDMIKNAATQADIENIWTLLSEDVNINIGQKRVLLLINKLDVFILFDDIINNMK